MSGTGELSLYFHIPFCSRKCPYCHFYVLPDKDPYKTLLLKALEREWEKIKFTVSQCKIVSIYFGGGTPTLFGAKALEKVLSWITPDSAEITLEANPEEVTLDLMRSFKKIGINRVSLGVQSFDDFSLLQLGRAHSSKKAAVAIEAIHQAGIDNISIDLMYDLPKQTVRSWKETLSLLSSLPITHLSLYNLTIEPGTVFFKNKKEIMGKLPNSEESLEMLELATKTIEEVGLKRYEISAFAKKGSESVHNTGYWTARPFFGLGPSAFSYFEKRRFRNVANLMRYAKALELDESPIDFEEKLSFPDALHELLAIELRLLRGLDLTRFQNRHGIFPASTLQTLERIKKKGWLKMEKNHLQLSKEGLLFYDSVAEELI